MKELKNIKNEDENISKKRKKKIKHSKVTFTKIPKKPKNFYLSLISD